MRGCSLASVCSSCRFRDLEYSGGVRHSLCNEVCLFARQADRDAAATYVSAHAGSLREVFCFGWRAGERAPLAACAALPSPQRLLLEMEDGHKLRAQLMQQKAGLAALLEAKTLQRLELFR